jgi:hypothetical protein
LSSITSEPPWKQCCVSVEEEIDPLALPLLDISFPPQTPDNDIPKQDIQDNVSKLSDSPPLLSEVQEEVVQVYTSHCSNKFQGQYTFLFALIASATLSTETCEPRNYQATQSTPQ